MNKKNIFINYEESQAGNKKGDNSIIDMKKDEIINNNLYKKIIFDHNLSYINELTNNYDICLLRKIKSFLKLLIMQYRKFGRNRGNIRSKFSRVKGVVVEYKNFIKRLGTWAPHTIYPLNKNIRINKNRKIKSRRISTGIPVRLRSRKYTLRPGRTRRKRSTLIKLIKKTRIRNDLKKRVVRARIPRVTVSPERFKAFLDFIS